MAKTVTIFFLAATMISGTGYAKGDTLGGVSQKQFDKLEKLGLAKKYDAGVDGVVEDNSAKLASANEALKVANEKITQLETASTVSDEALKVANEKITQLDGFVKEAINLAKGTKPDGYEG